MHESSGNTRCNDGRRGNLERFSEYLLNGLGICRVENEDLQGMCKTESIQCANKCLLVQSILISQRIQD